MEKKAIHGQNQNKLAITIVKKQKNNFDHHAIKRVTKKISDLQNFKALQTTDHTY